MKRGWLALALCLVGCDGIGDPIVDKIPPRMPLEGFMCMTPEADCDARFVSQAPFAPPVLRDPARSCGGNLSAEPCRDAAQGGRCTLALRVVEGIRVPLPAQLCAVLDLSAAPGSDNVELAPLSAESSRIVLHAEQPTTFVLDEVTLSNVAIELRGPVTLRLQGALRDVSISGSDEAEVTILDSRGTTLAVELGGSLRVQRSALTNSELHARDVVLETVPVNEVSVRAERMVGIELSGRVLRLDVSDLSLSEVELNEASLHRCDSALLVNARLSRPTLTTCSQRLRIHSSSLTNGRAQGFIESRSNYFSGMHFGAGGADTTLEAWEGTVTSSVFCPSLRRLTLSPASSATCNDCMQLANPEQHLCLHAVSQAEPGDAGILLTGGNDSCPLLDEGLPICDPPPSYALPP